MKYIKKPIPVEAFQIKNEVRTVEEWEEILPKWFNDAIGNTIVYDSHCNGVYVKTLEGEMFAPWGSYIIKGIDGELYPCKKEIFEKTYEVYFG